LFTGVPEDKIIEAHGTFVTAHCLNGACKKEYNMRDIKGKIFRQLFFLRMEFLRTKH